MITALTQNENIALITGLCVAVPATLTAWPAIMAKRSSDKARTAASSAQTAAEGAQASADGAQHTANDAQAAIGIPNGRGTLTVMSGRVLDELAGLREDIREVRADVRAQGERVTRVEGRMDDVERNNPEG